MPFEIRRLHPNDDRTRFHCGEGSLDLYFRRFAGQNQFRHHVGVTYVAIEDGHILGFVTVAATELELIGLPMTIRRKLPPLPLPGLRVARLAVDQGAQGQGIGAALLRFSFEVALRMRDELGCVGVVVDAKPDAVAFYARYGFTAEESESGQLGDRPAPVPMFLSISAIG